FFAVAEGPAIHIHADKLVGEFGIHVASKLHGVVEGFFAMFEAVSDAVANGLRDQAAQFVAQSPAHGVATQGEREAGELLPPDAQVDDAMQPKLRKEE